MNKIRCVVNERFLVGESPRWHEDEQALYWVDIYRPSIERFTPSTGTRRSWPMPERIGCFSFCMDGRVIAGMQSGIAFVDLNTGEVTRVFDLAPDNPESRFNDGRVDHQGRFWVGSLLESMNSQTNVLFRYDPDGTCSEMVGNLTCPNGLAFSPDGTTMYHSDSRQDFVWAWDVDPTTGAISNRRVFIDNDPMEGRPDGATVDSEGCYWIACVGAWRVARFMPDGTIDRVIGIPAQRPTACALGGTDFKTLYVTTATFPLDDAALLKQPLAGGIFAVDVDIPGLAERRFGTLDYVSLA